MTVTAYDVATTYSLTINGKTVSTLGTGGTVSTTATALVAAWDAATEDEFAEVDASATGASGVITLTSESDEGEPFTVTSAESGGTGTIGDPANTTAPTGPYHWDDAANWSGGSVPTDGDTVYLDSGDGDVRYGMAQTAVTLAALHITAGYTGKVGLADTHPSGYPEYRDRYLAIKATLVYVGRGEGQGSQRIRLDNSTAQAAVRVSATGTGSEAPLPAFCWKGTHASNAMYVSRGEVGVALTGGEVATLATLEVGYLTSQQSDSTVRCGSGVTLGTLQQTGGRVVLDAGLTTVDKRAGTLEVEAGNITAVNQYGGSLLYRGAGTITDLNDYGGLADFSQSTEACVVTDAVLRNSIVKDPLGRVTWTNPIVIQGPYASVSLDLGRDRSIAVS